MSESLVSKKAGEFTDTYLQQLRWSEDASEYVKILVAGNVRAFSSDLSAYVARMVLESVEKKMGVPNEPQSCVLLGRVGLGELKKEILG